MVTKALGFIALVGVATSVNAVNLTLTPGDGPVGVPAELSDGPVGAVASMTWGPVNQGGGAGFGDFTAFLESAVTDWGGGKLAFWYKISNNARRDPNGGSVPTNPIEFMGVFLPVTPTQVQVNQQSGPNSATLASFLGPVGFAYTQDPIVAGERSTWGVIFTDFTSYDIGKVRVTGGNSQDLFGIVPVPEPATYAGMFALGLAGFAAYRRFRA